MKSYVNFSQKEIAKLDVIAQKYDLELLLPPGYYNNIKFPFYCVEDLKDDVLEMEELIADIVNNGFRIVTKKHSEGKEFVDVIGRL